MTRTTAPEDQPARYDGIADGYARWWAPIIAPAAVGLLERTMRLGSVREPHHVVDIGTGTGTLGLAAVERWPEARVVGVDASSEMAARARREADVRLAPSDRGRFEVKVALADRLPLGDAGFDLAISSFVLQLVPSRPRALREARRVLVPGGHIAYVSWLAGDRPFAPDGVVDDVLGEFGFDPREDDHRSGDVPSVESAIAQMRRAGFAEVRAEAAVLEHRWTPEGYVGFVEHFDDEATFSELGRDRPRVRRILLERLGRLSPEAMTLRLPIVYVVGRSTSS